LEDNTDSESEDVVLRIVLDLAGVVDAIRLGMSVELVVDEDADIVKVGIISNILLRYSPTVNQFVQAIVFSETNSTHDISN